MIMIVDNFYTNVDEVREYALSLEYKTTGNYPGFRTESVKDPIWKAYIKAKLENLLNRQITSFDAEHNTSFQFTTELSDTWVHSDLQSFAAVLYLTPEPLLDSGTALYRHKKSGTTKHTEGLDIAPDARDLTHWEMLAEAKNVYNRLVIYEADQYHRSVVPGFGTDKYTGRLFQTFFFEANK